MEDTIRNLAEEIRRLEGLMSKTEGRLIDEIRRECTNISREVDALAKEANNQALEIQKMRRRLMADPTADQKELMEYIHASKRGTTVDHIMNMLYEYDPMPISHSVILRKIYRRLRHKAPEFQWIINSLKEKMYIEEVIVNNSIFYKLTPLGLERRSARLSGQPLDAPMDEPQEPQIASEPVKYASPWDVLDKDLNGVIDLTKGP